MLKAGDKVTAKITSIAQFGAFCTVEDGGDIINGLIHISELSDYFVSNVNDFVNVDEEYEVEVISFDDAKKQVKLSFKRLRPELLKANKSKLQETGSGFKDLKSSVDKEIANEE